MVGRSIAEGLVRMRRVMLTICKSFEPVSDCTLRGRTRTSQRYGYSQSGICVHAWWEAGGWGGVVVFAFVFVGVAAAGAPFPVLAQSLTRNL